jgi:small subunit ribosomal protein S5
VKQGRPKRDWPGDGQGQEREFVEKPVFLNRVAKVVKGGRRFSFSAMMAVGDKAGRVGLGMGKANEVPEAFRKAVAKAKKNMRKIYIKDGTIPFQVMGHFGAGKVLLKPASRGTGVIAGGAVRAIMEVVGIKDILTKSLGSSNQANMALATMEGLARLEDPENLINSRKTAQ